MLLLRLIIFLIFFPIYSIFLNIFGLCCQKATWFLPCYQTMVKFWNCWILWTIDLKVQISKKEQAQLQTSYPKIIIANHKSHLDSCVLWAIMPKSVTLCFAAKKELFNIPVFGKILYYSGSIIIDRKNAQLALQNLQKFFTTTKVTKTLVIYAEGTRSNNDKLLPFKRGPFKIAQELTIPLLPVVIHGTAMALPKGKYWPKATTVTVKVLTPVLVDTLPTNSAEALKATIWQTMQDELLQLQAK